MTYMHAALAILAHADRPLTVPELTAVAIADGLIRPRGKTPDRTMSSVLYRRMAGDPDAPVMSRNGRFWLRGRPLPAAEAVYSSGRVHHPRRSTSARGTAVPARPARAHRAAVLPPPPLHLPTDAVPVTLSPRRGVDYAPMRRNRAVARAGERAAPVLERVAARRAAGTGWNAERTDTRLVRPLLSHLGYRVDLTPAGDGPRRRVVTHLLHADRAPAITVQVRHLGHDLDEDDAWRALAQARHDGARYAATTNGRELRLYAAGIAEARDAVAAALILVLDLIPAPEGSGAGTEQASALWLLARDTVAGGGLDAYVAGRVVGSALLDALDVPESALARALVAEVRARGGAALPPGLILRHARLVLRGRRGRDGEPAAEDVAAVAAVRTSSVVAQGHAVDVARSA